MNDLQKVEREFKKWLKGPQEDGWLSISLKLLRAERRSFVRMVNKQMHSLNPTMASENLGKGYRLACGDILKALTARRKP